MINRLPHLIHQSIQGLTPIRNNIGVSGDNVFAIIDNDRPKYYLKIGDSQSRVGSEYDRLIWLEGKARVPQVVAFQRENNKEYLLTTAASGLVASHSDFSKNKVEIVKALARALQSLHSISVENCPFDCALQTQIEEAAANTAAGVVDETDFDEARLGRSAADLLEELKRTQPFDVYNVFTHGDYCLPNVLIDPLTFDATFIDIGRAGVSDRYLDLALGTRSITYNFGPDLEEIFLKEYGIDSIDRDRIEFYRLLDEFF